MTKIVMLAVALLASTAWLQAQQYPPDTSKQPGSSQNKVEGCLQGLMATSLSPIALELPISFRAIQRS